MIFYMKKHVPRVLLGCKATELFCDSGMSTIKHLLYHAIQSFLLSPKQKSNYGHRLCINDVFTKIWTLLGPQQEFMEQAAQLRIFCMQRRKAYIVSVQRSTNIQLLRPLHENHELRVLGGRELLHSM